MIEVDLIEASKPSECSVDGCGRKIYGRGFCKAHHQWRWKRGLLPESKQPTVAEILQLRSMPITETGCLIWVGPVNNKGYGRVSRHYAHRIAYEMHVGTIPDGMEVCHRCDTPACINHHHLFLGTHLENMQDSVRKGRARQTVKRGTEHGMAKLSEDDVRRLRAGAETIHEAAERLGIHWATAQRARDRITYRSVA